MFLCFHSMSQCFHIKPRGPGLGSSLTTSFGKEVGSGMEVVAESAAVSERTEAFTL